MYILLYEKMSIYLCQKMYKQSYLLHHSGPLSHQGKDLPRLENLFPRQYDVGVDNNDFHPVSFWEVKKKIEQQIAKESECHIVWQLKITTIKNSL